MNAPRFSPLSRCSPVQVRSARVGVASRWVAISAGERSFHAAFFAFNVGFGFSSEDSADGTLSSLTTEADGVCRDERGPRDQAPPLEHLARGRVRFDGAKFPDCTTASMLDVWR